MGFKADSSFLRFLTMGAAGVHRTMEQLEQEGFRPIELERYCASNKIWATKVKRLRLPDLLCVKTGMRAEVRAKSDLKIRMSDAPNNPDRVWDAGLRDDDLVAFIACSDGANGPEPADQAVFFTIESLRTSVEMSRLGPPKSASEGAERDRTWPATVPSRNGRVLETTAEKLIVEMAADDQRPARRQTYTLNGKHVYVSPGDEFSAVVTFIAGAPDSMADLQPYLTNQYDPLAEIESENPVDRYAAVKSLAHRDDPRPAAIAALERVIDEDDEPRVALEAAGTAVFLGSERGQAAVNDYVWNNDERPDLRMEAVLILSELGPTDFSRQLLIEIAGSDAFKDDELRQAAVWGLGKGGLRAYDNVLPFVVDDEENVALHAIAAFGVDTPRPIIDRLVDDLLQGDPNLSAAASEVLRLINSDEVLEALVAAANQNPHEWILATLCRLPPEKVRIALQGNPLLDQVSPFLLLSDPENWLAGENIQVDIAFLRKQNL